ncbi:hypothetical protein CL634_01065 [bacterium]|nr:hypothetical protein [bacterium]
MIICMKIVYYWVQMRMARCAWEYLRGSDYSGMINKDARCIEAMDDMNRYYLRYRNCLVQSKERS